MNDIERAKYKKKLENQKQLWDSEMYRGQMAVNLGGAYGFQLAKLEADGFSFEDAFELTRYHFRVQAEIMNALADTVVPSDVQKRGG